MVDHLFLQKERLNQRLNFCRDDQFSFLPFDLSLHLHNGWAAPVPEMVKSVLEVVHCAIFP